jgi:hypothetical protein
MQPASGADATLSPPLLATAGAALARGLARPALVRTDAEASIAAIYMEKFTRDLTVDEARVLESITGIRERGLAFCRAGNVRDGGAMIAHARGVLTRASISREAFVLADSFLCASEGFLHFRCCRADAAVSSMLMAIDRCRELRDAYSYPVEGRRIHLACNAVRVQAESARYQEVPVAIGQLLNLIDRSDRRFWSYPELEYASEPDRLDDDVRWELMDQVLAVARRLSREESGQVTAAFPSSPGEVTPLAARARCFLEAVNAHSSGDLETFAARCTEFFPAGPQYLPRAFRHLADRLTKEMADRTY